MRWLGKGATMKIVSYCRVSTDREEQLNSLDNQKEFFEEYGYNKPNAKNF